MGNDVTSVSRHAKVNFMDTDEQFIGTIIYSGSETEMSTRSICISNFKFKPDDASKPMGLFDFWRVKMITFLD